MSKRMWVVVLLFLGNVSVQAGPDEWSLPRTADGELMTGRYAELKMSGDRMGHMASGEIVQPAPYLHDYDQKFLQLNLVPNLEDSTFAAKVRLVVQSEIPSLTTLGFHLHTSSVIDSIVVDGTQRSFSRSDAQDLINIWPFIAENGQVDVDLADLTLQQDDEIALDIYYHGEIALLGGAGLTYQWGTNSRPAPEVLYTMHEPHDARLWLACFDQPGDKLDSTRIVVTLPESFEVLSNGVLEYEDSEVVGPDTLKTTSWFNPNPISTYLIHFAAKDYYVHDAGTAGVNDTPVHYWVYKQWYYIDPINPVPYSVEDAIYDLGRTPQMIEAFEAAFGPYPFTKYDQAIMPMGGAMEHQSATSLGESYAGKGDRSGEMVVAHELGHQWWGDFVGPHSFQDTWLNEGFATYSEPIWLESFFPQLVPTYMLEMQSAAKGQDAGTGYPISDPPYPYTVSLVYDKGGAVLHMLRLEMGDEDFFNGLKSYGAAHAYGSATTDNFQAAMEAASGLDLNTFFAQWVHGKRWPRFDLIHWWSEPNGDGKYDTYLIVDQVQSWEQLFETAIKFRVRNTTLSGADTLLVAHVAAARRDTVHVGTFDWAPDYLSFNHENWIMCDVYTDQLTGVDSPEFGQLPLGFQVSSAWPNPFNGSSSFEITLPRAAEVNVEVVNMLGRRVAILNGGRMTAGQHRMSWAPAANLASGVYLIRVRAADQQLVKRVTLVR